MTATARLLLIEERKRRGWSQQEVADRLGTTQNNVSRWELGLTTPDSYFRLKLCELFGKTAAELGLSTAGKRKDAPNSQSDQSFISTPEVATPPVWQVPFHRNALFTGREEQLARLFEQLHRSRPESLTRIQAISGLAGIGKTQLALEYAYRYEHNYRAVFWIRAETHEVLLADFSMLASCLQLPEKDTQEQRRVVQAVRGWLATHSDWLLLLDNVENLTLLAEVLPTRPAGHILLTTRLQVTGTLAHRFDLNVLEQQEGVLFLLRRAKCIAPDACLEEVSEVQQSNAREISQIMDGLPLALDQAGAYIEETGCSLSDYLTRYQTRRAVLLNQRGTYSADHPESVTSTFSLAIEQVERASPAAADLLRLCAFLHPDALPEEVLVEAVSQLSPALQAAAVDTLTLDTAIKELRRFSLLRRHPETKTLTLHRLVQAVLRDTMSQESQQQWAELAVRAVNQVFPEEDFAAWSQCQRFLPQAQACASLINDWAMTFPEAIRLLQQTGRYLRERAQYAQAEPFFSQVRSIREQTLGTEHPRVAESLANLGELSYYQGRYTLAESLFQRALSIRQRALGPEHPEVAETLNSLGQLSYYQGKYAQTELLYQQALHIRKHALGGEHPHVAESLDNLAHIYSIRGKYAQAEPLFQRALAISELALGPEHPNVAYSLNNLANLYRIRGKYVLAEPLFQRALAIRQQILGPVHPRIAESLANLGLLYGKQGRYTQAEDLLRQAQAIYEQVLGTAHPTMAAIFNELADLSRAQGRYLQAEELLRRALAIHEQRPEVEDHRVAQCLNSLAELHRIQGNTAQADSCCRRALAIRQQTLGPEHPHVVSSLATLARLSHDQGEDTQAELLFQRAQKLCEQTLGPEHPDLVQLLTDAAELSCIQGKYKQAEALYQQALALGENALGLDHPDRAASLHGLAKLYSSQGKYDEAEPLYRRALRIREKVLGPGHSEVVVMLENYTSLLSAMRPKP